MEKPKGNIYNHLMNGVTHMLPFVVGGGIIGGVFAILFDKLFSFTGMEIVSCVMIGLGILLFTGFFAYNMFGISFRGDVSNVHKDIETSQMFETNEIEKCLDAELELV